MERKAQDVGTRQHVPGISDSFETSSTDLSLFESRSFDGSTSTNGSSRCTTDASLSCLEVVPDDPDVDHLDRGHTPYVARDVEIRDMWLDGIAQVRMSAVTNTPSKALASRANAPHEAKVRFATASLAKYKAMDARQCQERDTQARAQAEQLVKLQSSIHGNSMAKQGLHTEYKRRARVLIRKQHSERTTTRSV